MDSEGLYTLLVARHRHKVSHGGHLAVVIDPNSPAIVELHTVSLKASFDLHHTLIDALRACADADQVKTQVTLFWLASKNLEG
jgi:hypothetical protein